MILWMDSFDHYGDSDDMRSVWSVYNEVRGSLSTVQARTGAQSFMVGGNDGTEAVPALRRNLGGVFDVVGVGAAFYLNQLPSANLRYVLFEFLSPANNKHYCIFVDTTGRLVAMQDELAAADATSAVAITANAWTHVEARLVCDSIYGEIEVRVNGATVIFATDLDTQGDAANADVGSVATNCRDVGGASLNDKFWVDDIFAWNDLGGVNDDFIGDRRIFTLMPGTETSASAFNAVGASDPIQAINELSPDDTSYIEAGTLTGSVPAVAEILLVNNLPANIGIIDAVQSYARMRKSGTARCYAQVSLVVNEDTAEGDERPVGATNFAYYTDIHQTSPDGSDMWTKGDIEMVRIARVD